MVNTTLVLLSTTAFFVTGLSVLLSDAQQRALALWNVRAWCAIDQCRQSLARSRVGRFMRQDTPIVTAVATVGMFVMGILWSTVFASFLIPSAAAFLGGILLACDGHSMDWKDVQLITLWGAIAGVSVTGLVIGIKGWLLSVAIFIVALFLIPLSIIEFVARRIAEYEKGPLVAVGVLIAALLSLLKAIL